MSDRADLGLDGLLIWAKFSVVMPLIFTKPSEETRTYSKHRREFTLVLNRVGSKLQDFLLKNMIA